MTRAWSVTAHVTIKLVNHTNPEKSYSKGCKDYVYLNALLQDWLYFYTAQIFIMTFHKNQVTGDTVRS